MKIGVAGTGAVGGYFGGFLQKAGHDVIFLARGEHLRVMKERGLVLETESGSHTIAGQYTDRYEDLGDVDLVLFCVKSTDTKQIAEKLLPILKDKALILTMQNGVDNEEILATVFGESRILSCATYVQAHIKEPGIVKQIGEVPKLVIGALAEHNEQAQVIGELFEQAGIESKITRQIMKRKWQKLLWNVTFNPLTALLQIDVKDIMDNKELRVTAANICQESVEVANKLGIEFDEQTVVKILASGELARNHKTSMLQDRMKGKKMEIDSICGYIVKKGTELAVPTPTLAVIYKLLTYINKQVD